MSRVLNCITIPNFVAIGQTSLKFLPVGTVKKVEMRHCAKFHRNRLNRGQDMVISQDGGCRHLGFLNFQIFNGWNGQDG